MIPISKPYIGDEEKTAVLEVLQSGMLVQGTRVARLEERFAKLCGVKHAIATSSGTTALQVALLAHGIGPGDEVITTPFTFAATASSIISAGAKPVFVDIDEQTFNIDPNQVARVVTSRTKAILPVHLFGLVCDMDALQGIAQRHGLAIIEDACQAVGATCKGQLAGSFGTGAFSFYATKNLMAGEGGMITTDSDKIAETSRLIRNHGMKRRYYHDILGYNFRLSDLHAAIGLAQMDRLSAFDERRRANAAYFNARLTSVLTPVEPPGYGHVWHQYTIRLDGGRDRDKAVEKLSEAGIGTGIFYPVPLHKQQYIRALVGDITLPVAEKLAQQVISLPVHPQLGENDLASIVNEVNKL